MEWFLIKTKPNSDFIASKNLEDQNFKVFLPLILTTSRSAKKFVTKTIPLFPSYLFIGTSLKEIPWKSVNATRGVSKAVTFDGIYRPINKSIMEDLQFRCDQKGILQNGPVIKAGDQVKIERGPFHKFIGKVEEIDKQKRVWLLIKIMQQKTRALVHTSDLSKLD